MGGLAEVGGGSIIGTYAGTIMSKESGNDQSLDRTFRTVNDGGTPVSACGLAAGVVAVAVLGGAVKAAVVSDGKDLPVATAMMMRMVAMMTTMETMATGPLTCPTLPPLPLPPPAKTTTTTRTMGVCQESPGHCHHLKKDGRHQR
jgi:hypothetical protein